MKEIIVQAYQYSELDDNAKHNVKDWLDEGLLDYELFNEDRKFIGKYFIDMDEKDIIEHCNSNNYLFSLWGEPIHQYRKK
jgi:hypothetical protein